MLPTTQPSPAAAPDAGTLAERVDALTQVDAWIAEAQANGEVEDGVVPDWLAELHALAHADFKSKVEGAARAVLDAYKAKQPIPDGVTVERSVSLRIR